MDETKGTTGTVVTPGDIRAICGDLLDWKVSAIIDLQPALADLAAAVAWANGQDNLGEEGHPLTGETARIYDILVSDPP